MQQGFLRRTPPKHWYLHQWYTSALRKHGLGASGVPASPKVGRLRASQRVTESSPTKASLGSVRTGEDSRGSWPASPVNVSDRRRSRTMFALAAAAEGVGRGYVEGNPALAPTPAPAVPAVPGVPGAPEGSGPWAPGGGAVCRGCETSSPAGRKSKVMWRGRTRRRGRSTVRSLERKSERNGMAAQGHAQADQ